MLEGGAEGRGPTEWPSTRDMLSGLFSSDVSILQSSRQESFSVYFRPGGGGGWDTLAESPEAMHTALNPTAQSEPGYRCFLFLV